MKTLTRSRLGAWARVAAIAVASQAIAMAGNIAITDPSFEATGTFAFLSGGNWTITQGSAANAAPDSGQFPGGAPNGTKIATLGGGLSGSNIFQSLSVTVDANSTYTLSFDVGIPTGGTAYSFSAFLIAGGVFLHSTQSVPTIAPGTFGLASFTFDTSDTFNAFAVGNSLAIDINQTDTTHDGYFDNVTLTEVSNAAPEPTSMFLLFGGIPAVVGFAKLRRK